MEALDKKRVSNARILIGVLLVLAVAAVYWNAPKGAFLVHHDDDDYVTGNPNVRDGLSVRGVAWAFTHSHAANWHPLTWISHQLDVELFGLNPRGHHMTSLILHALNTILLFLLLERMTGYAWRSGFAAALFAVHPLHVESVAWIAERKDVLSTFFMMLAIFAYAGYARKPGFKRYLLTALLFAMGLLSKPMLVTLPFALLLLDCWPLERVAWRGRSEAREEGKTPEAGSLPARFGPGRLILEKLPLIALSAASSVATVIAQKGGGAMQSLPLGVKISNALLACVKYIGMMFWPKDLAAMYPHPEGAIPLWQAAAAALLLIAATAMVLWLGRRRPYLPVGWSWYLGTLVPVIGIVQVGNQSMADRYTYIPLIGLFIILAWGVPDLFRRRSGAKQPVKKRTPRQPAWIVHARMLGVTAIAILIALTAAARRQCGFWKDSITLFRHALAVTEDNHLAEHDLGMAFIKSGKVPEGLRHLHRAIEIKPEFGVAYANLAMIHCALGRFEEAWKNAHLSRKYGCELDESFLAILREKMADPGE